MIKNFLLFFLLAPFSFSLKGSSQKSTALLLESFYQRPNFKFPWRKEAVRKNKILVFKIVHNKKIYFVTTENLIHHVIRLMDVEGRQNFSVKWLDSERNLVFLEPPGDFQSEMIESFELSEEVPLGMDVQLYAKVKGKTQKSNLVKIRALSLGHGPYSTYKFLHYRVEDNLSDLSQGGALISRDKLIALCNTKENNLVSCIPSFTIRKSLENFISGEGKSYFPSLRFEISGLGNPLIYSHLGNLPAGMKDDDKILEIDGHSLNERGEISHKLWKSVNYRFLLEKKRVGEAISLLMQREGKKMKMNLTLTAQDSNTGPVLYYESGSEELYFFVGGLVFQRLSLDYLRSYGENWEYKVPPQFYYLLHYGRRNGFRGDAIIVSQVLPGAMSKGYETLKNALVEKVEGASPLNFSDLKRTFNPLSRKIEITFGYGEGSLILEPEWMEKEEKFIKKIYEL